MTEHLAWDSPQPWPERSHMDKLTACCSTAPSYRLMAVYLRLNGVVPPTTQP